MWLRITVRAVGIRHDCMQHADCVVGFTHDLTMLPVKKIQFSGWSSRDYAQVRNKVSGCFDKEEDTHYINLKRKKKCKGGKEHYFVRTDHTEMLGFSWKTYQCDLCGKRKWEFKK